MVPLLVKEVTKKHNAARSGTCFDALVYEIAVQVIAQLSNRGDLWSLALVSRHYNEITTPFLYSDIRLLPCTTLESNSLPHASVLSAQRCFRATLETRPHLALCVRRISWHLDGDKDDISSFARFLFSMGNIQEAHFASSYALTRFSSSAILPKCQTMTLEGLTSLDFAMSVLHPHQLQTLSLDSDYQFTIPILEWIPHQSFPHITSIHLYLRFQVVLSTPAPGEYQAFMACKQVLLSLRGTLENVTIGLRKAKSGHATFSFLSNPLANAAQKLPRYVLPVFLEEKFPRMRRLLLEGMRIGHPGISPRLIEDIQAAIPLMTIDILPAKSVGSSRLSMK